MCFESTACNRATTQCGLLVSCLCGLPGWKALCAHVILALQDLHSFILDLRDATGTNPE